MKNILIIKLGADGDVLRTLPLAKALKTQNPDSKITWVTKGDISTLLENIPYIDSIHTLPFTTSQQFDLLYNFDIEKEATDLAKTTSAKEKYGFSEEAGYPTTFNLGAEYYLNTLFDDELKKSNTKTYQEMMFEVANLPYTPENKTPYKIILTRQDKLYAQQYIQSNNLQDKKIIGIHMGAGSRWPSKAWHPNKVKELIKKLNTLNHSVILFGGPNEQDSLKILTQELKQNQIPLYTNKPTNTKRQFASLLSICDKVICSDSFALHVSIALNKPTIALFFCTSPTEVESYNLVKKITSPLLPKFFPELSDQYNEELVNSISTDQVLNALEIS